MITIVDFGMGNLRSIQSKFDMMKIQNKIVSKSEDLADATKIILPGVGHFRAGINNLRSQDLIEPLSCKVMEEKVPILGICLGMQLLAEYSEEGDCAGLGWINGNIRRFSFEMDPQSPRVPHVGWNQVQWKRESILMKDIPEEKRFYFTHSFYFETFDENLILATTNHGITFTSAISSNNIYGTQFHPEKSHLTGLKILENFARRT
ncbi:MAG: imidazole glycerol phosphate synthase subunit HisH [Bdellovibrionales bacterium]|nr:imidazole glycerol phosphate synthase subunit HisH [Bdellovibrionales bacterium]